MKFEYAETWVLLVTLVLGAALTASSAFAAKGKTFTGTVQ